MDVNTNYGTNYSANINVLFPGSQNSSTAKAGETSDIVMPGSKTPHQMLQAEIHEKVLMNLQEVQNFLYMLIGSDLKVEESRQQLGNSINMTA
jgi:hypothetical protein